MRSLDAAKRALRDVITGCIAVANGPYGPHIDADFDKAIDEFAEAVISETFQRLHVTRQLRSDE